MSDNEQMNKKVETVADILEEMRGMGNYQRYSCDHAHALADRIEAAWKRERAKVEADALSVGGIVEAARHKPVGNAAAMCEAFQKIREKCVIYNNDLAEEIDALCGNALAAPARNCDMYLTQPEMSRAYEEYRDAAMKRYGNGLTGRVPTVKQKPMTYDEWLLAPAAERKGEGDA